MLEDSPCTDLYRISPDIHQDQDALGHVLLAGYIKTSK